MHEPANLLTRAMRDEAVVRYSDGYLQVWLGDIPLGGKIQTKGPRCPWWQRHDWEIDEYERLSGLMRDNVCRKCKRRRPLN